MSMIRITRDELKSSANEYLLTVARQISQDIDDFYRYTWLAPLRLIKKTVESETLGGNEKISLLTEGMKSVPDIAALQISVQGLHAPLLVTQVKFTELLKKRGMDPATVLELDPSQMEKVYGKNEIIISDLEYIENVDTWLITVALPIEEKTFGRPAGLSARINLERLKKRVKNNPFTKNGKITLVGADGREIFARERADLSHREIVKTAKKLLSSNARTIGVQLYQRNGEKMLSAYSFPGILDMAVIVEKTETDAYAAVSRMEMNLLVWVCVGTIIAVLGAAIVSISLTRPLMRLTRAARQISEGNLMVQIEGKEQGDEIGELSQAFNKMVEDLARYIHELTETTRAKERVESELKLAQKIQQNFLPKSFPLMKNIKVYGKCEPAREVGGDYFDFFKIDDRKYGMVIGDVTGKGVPAALFMAVSRTLFRFITSRDKLPDRVLTEFNNRLVGLDRRSDMFITLFYGIYDTESGKLVYSTAGHNMPFIKQENQPAQGFRMLPGLKTMVAGMLDGLVMERGEIGLQKGDVIVLYTDGITEAMNDNDEFFGENRLESFLNEHGDLMPDDLSNRLVDEVRNFQQNREPFDDMTVFVMKILE
jgi:serine phosphatase RsbU (regulator of sigma subunit)